MFNKEEEKEPKPWLLKSEVHESKGFGPVLSKGQAKKEEDVKKKEHGLNELISRKLFKTEDKMTDDIDPNDIITRNQSCDEALEIGGHEQHASHIIMDEPMDVEMSITHPAKRLRTFIDFVLIPPRQKVLTTVLEGSIEEMNEKMAKLKNVKKNENLVFTIDTVHERLRNGPGLDIFPISLEKSIRDEGVSRKFMSATYGGSSQATSPRIAKKFLDKHGLDDWLYLSLDYHPSAPEVPGAPGLFFSINGNPGDWEGKFRVFTRIHPSPAIWQYMGQYVLKSCPSLTKEEWCQQAYKVRSTWGIHTCKHGWGDYLRAQIALRKQSNSEPTEVELNNALESGSHKSVTPDDVIAAFSNGDLIMSIWTMKCVGYEADFQRNVVDGFSAWVPPPPKPKKGKSDINTRGRKERVSTPDSSDLEDNVIEPRHTKKGKPDIKTRGRKARAPTSDSSDSEDGVEPHYIELSD